jgi:hypothetical protein
VDSWPVMSSASMTAVGDVGCAGLPLQDASSTMPRLADTDHDSLAALQVSVRKGVVR